MRLWWILILTCILDLAAPIRAQIADLKADRVPMSDLAGPWRFHAGDDPAWAQPGFDDSGWSLLSADRGWSEQGYKGYSGMGWYRLKVDAGAQHGRLGFYLPSVDESCEVYANGRLIGKVGDLPPHPKIVFKGRDLFPIPSEVLDGKTLLIAVRVWHSPRFAGIPGGGLEPAPRMGDLNRLAEWRKLQGRDVYWRISASVLEFLANILTGIAGVGLFLLRRRERAYGWFGVSQLLWAVLAAETPYRLFRPMSYTAAWIIGASVMCAARIIQFEFLTAFLGQKRGRLYAAAVTLASITCIAELYVVFRTHDVVLGYVVYLIAGLAVEGIMVAFISRGVREEVGGARVLLAAFALKLLIDSLGSALQLPFLSGLAWAQTVSARLSLTRWPFPISAGWLTSEIEMFAVLATLILGYARSRQDEERLASELEAARAVQQVLIPEEIPSIPGFEIQSVYKPAGQVGGDFFQIIALPAGGALIVVGDVSGKGMPAAMTVSLLVGTFRTLAHFTQRPAEILRAMNQRMLARSKGGFTTCVVLQVAADGMATAANAGHIPPYLKGREVPLENGLPLGLAADSAYAERSFSIPADERLTLLTDGVIEARNAQGELFGFERASALSTRHADEIARAAIQFGQEDDITVISLTRRAIRNEASAETEPALTASPA